MTIIQKIKGIAINIPKYCNKQTIKRLFAGGLKMDRITLEDIKGYVGACEDLYFADSALILHVSDGKGRIEQIIVGNKSGRVAEADSLRKDFFLHKDIEVEAGRLRASDNYKAINRIFGDTVQIDGTIKINSEPKYTFYSVEKQGGFFPGYRIARLEEIK